MIKNLPANAENVGDAGLIPGSGRSPGGRHGNALQCSFPALAGGFLTTEPPASLELLLVLFHISISYL